VSVKPLTDGDRDPVPILVTVQEAHLEAFGNLTLSVGVATDKLPHYAYVAASYLWQNVLGLGSQLELKGDFAWVTTYGVSARYSDLRVFGPGWKLDVSLFYRNELTNRFGQVSSLGASAALSRYLSPALRVSGGYEVYQYNLNVGFNRVNASADPSSAPDNTITARLFLGVYWDRRVGADGRPNLLMPVRGWLLSAAGGYAEPALGSDHRFLKVSGQAVGLAPFTIRGAQFSLLGNFRYDQGFPFGESALPLVERYFAGGDTTTRGYDTDTLKSEIVKVGVSPLGEVGFRVVPEGGNLRMLNTVELQFPIAKSFLGLPWPWVGALFWDVGVIANSINIQASDVKQSVGVALLRVLTPVGPLSVEYAYPLTQTLAEERWKTNPWYSHYPGRIHFNWGIPLSRL
jgi:outer membrane protein assembly factor BamA